MGKIAITIVNFETGENISSSYKCVIARKLKKNPLTIYKWVKLAQKADNAMYYHKNRYIVILSELLRRGE